MMNYQSTEEYSREEPTTEFPVASVFNISRQTHYTLRLPIPSPSLYYDNYHHPLFPAVLSAINCYADPVNKPYSFPRPLGELHANVFDILGVRFHDFTYVNHHRERLFTKYMLWYLEIDDYLFRHICPSDLNDTPCEWDELQGGCPMLRLCETKHKYPHPHLGIIPACRADLLHQCRYVHDVQPTCRHVARQLRQRQEKHQYQLCDSVANGEICEYGHDFESARLEAVSNYWEHRRQAREQGSTGVVKRDAFGRKLLMPIRLEEEEGTRED